MPRTSKSNLHVQINLLTPVGKHKRKAIADLNSLKTIGNYLLKVFKSCKTAADFLAKYWSDIPLAVSKQVVTQSEENYEDHKDFFRVSSWLLRVMVNHSTNFERFLCLYVVTRI